MNRFRAASIHLMLSIVIVLSMMGLMLGLWYPGAYFKLMGGSNILFILAGVDVAIGPLLTLIVFKAGKKGLKADLVTIVILQLMALSYGSYTMFQARPVFNVFTGQRFQVASVADIEPNDLLQASDPHWRKFPLTGPLLLGSKLPEDQKEREAVLFAGLGGGGQQQTPKYWVAYDAVRDRVLSSSRPISTLRAANKDNVAPLEKLERRYEKQDHDLVYLPVTTKFYSMAAVIDAKTSDLIEIIDMRP